MRPEAKLQSPVWETKQKPNWLGRSQPTREDQPARHGWLDPNSQMAYSEIQVIDLAFEARGDM